MMNTPVTFPPALRRQADSQDLRSAQMPPIPFSATPLSAAVVIPTFNESGNVKALLTALDAVMADRRWEAIFVDDGSTDGTPEIIERIAQTRSDVRLIRRVGRRGLSSAIMEGMLSTIAPVVAVIDADMQHDEHILPGLLDEVEEGRADVAIGTRYAEGGSTGNWNATRCRISAAGTRLARAIIRRDISDPLSGFFAVRRSLVVDAAPKLSSVGFKILLDLIASSPHDVRIAELPYEFRCRHAGESKLDVMVSVEFAQLLIDKTVGHLLPPRLIMFLLVGAFGLVVNLSALAIGLMLGFGFVAAQVAAVGVAILSNFTLNNILTYRDRRLTGWHWLTGLASYALVCGIGAAGQVDFATLLYRNDAAWWLAGMAGATVGAVWNYTVTSFLTWKAR